MFTGIVEELGLVVALEQRTGAARLTVSGPLAVADAGIGDSIAVNGVCLTVAELADHCFTADVMAETLARTTLGDLVAGDAVNLERPLTLAARLGGHLVQGHVDGVGTVLERRPAQHWTEVDIAAPAAVTRYIVEKGSITVDGISLTVAALHADGFDIAVIPHTLAVTTLGPKATGDPVNLEVDVLAKYVERLLGTDQGAS